MKSRRWVARYKKPSNGQTVKGSCRKISKKTKKSKSKSSRKVLKCEEEPKTYKQKGYWRQTPRRKYVKPFCRTPHGQLLLKGEEEIPEFVEKPALPARSASAIPRISPFLALPAPASPLKLEAPASPLKLEAPKSPLALMLQEEKAKQRTAQPYAQPPVFGFSARKPQPYAEAQGPTIKLSRSAQPYAEAQGPTIRLSRSAQPYAQAKSQSPLAGLLAKEESKRQELSTAERLEGVASLFRTPKSAQPSTAERLAGVQRLFRTPQPSTAERLAGVERLFRTPKSPQPSTAERLRGLRSMFRTPAPATAERLAGVGSLFRTPEVVEVAKKKVIRKKRKSRY